MTDPIAGKCKVHDVDNVRQDAGRGKWIPICPVCEEERRKLIAEAFKGSFREET